MELGGGKGGMGGGDWQHARVGWEWRIGRGGRRNRIGGWMEEGGIRE